jgi:hypothetical protein
VALIAGVVVLRSSREEEMEVWRCDENRGGASDFYSGERVHKWSKIGRAAPGIVVA